jgi:hypothetical protein
VVCGHGPAVDHQRLRASVVVRTGAVRLPVDAAADPGTGLAPRVNGLLVGLDRRRLAVELRCGLVAEGPEVPALEGRPGRPRRGLRASGSSPIVASGSCCSRCETASSRPCADSRCPASTDPPAACGAAC